MAKYTNASDSNYLMVWSEYFKMQKSTNILNLIEIVGDMVGLGLTKSKIAYYY